MKTNGNGFQYLKTKFPRINHVKLKEELFAGRKIRDRMKNPSFKTYEGVFVKVCRSFLRNQIADNYQEFI